MAKAVKKVDRDWNIMYRQLSEFYSKNGHSQVPYRFKTNQKLGRWVQKQRSSKEKLGSSKIRLLNRLNFAWKEDKRKEKNKYWLLMFKKMEKFNGRYGHCNIPSKYILDKKLGRWVEVMRTRKEKLEDWKLVKLRAIGFQWSGDIKLKQERHWYDMYYKLENFYQKYDHSSVPEYWEKDKKLAIWVGVQRRPKKSLSKKKIQLLNQLKFKWNNVPLKRVRDKKGRFVSACE